MTDQLETQKYKLTIDDQVNVKFHNIDAMTRKKLVDATKFFLPYARHVPSFKMGRWDGKVNFTTAGGGTFLNILDTLQPILESAGYSFDDERSPKFIEIVDSRPVYEFKFPEASEDMIAHLKWPEGHVAAGEPIMLRDYQVDAIKTFFQNEQCMQPLSTGAGKTITTAVLSMSVEKYGKSIVIVPSKSLVEQTEEDYINCGLDVGVFYGDRKDFDKTHLICTWQSLANLSKKTRRDELKADEIGIHEFLEGVVCVMVDECHSAKADQLKDLLTGPMSHIPIRWGMTGTIPKEDFNRMALLCSIGPVIGGITANELQEKGVLSNCHVNIMQLQDMDHTFERAAYDEEVSFLSKDKKRLDYCANLFQTISENGNTLILVNNIETGKYLQSLIPESVFISGTVKTKDRKKEYKEVQVVDNKVIIATFGVAAVGINVPRIFNLVLFEAGKSFVRVIQSIGRGIRKAEDKDFVNIFDLCSNMKFSKKHLTKRKEFYREAKYPFDVTKIKY